MRAFIALEVPVEVKEELLRVQESLRTIPARCNFTNDFHITIGFWINGNVEILKKKLERIKHKKISAQINNIGTFGKPSKVVWAGITGEFHDLAMSMQKSEHFHPHITLLRVKKLFDEEKFSEMLKKIVMKKISFEIDTVSLFKSTPNNGFHTHERIASITLA
ncbi:RNA 2',3'-cyclic phosphodiesterase [Candidatus Woesearchaeota archaeon]|nr:RNA 2',3'-cyclic phosphodiesterase [Candidatus Woesearchaeota archaeon]